ncbi:uncharacterized protein LOC125671105 isoform X2 [Ostrea edulis]|uniref:uncharacterized protein LOC125671105 isoform X2 n=1 Tax=Ostrea edulis TaxID=37623 RepID=UPI0020945C0D|nr:uncharacterized protein LOC125671105 isoform X2 [Ostrea edulis]
MEYSFLACFFVLVVIFYTASEKQHDNFCCIERNYQYLHCQWEGTDNTSCWRLTNSGIPNASIYNIQGEENKLSCNISLNNYLQLEENEFVLINVCRNTTITTTFTTTDEYVQLNPVTDLRPTWSSRTTVNLAWRLPVSACSVNDESGGINCTASINTDSKPVPTNSGWYLPKVPRQEKWTAIRKSDSRCFGPVSMSSRFTNLQSSKKYRVRVKCRPLGSKYWSDVNVCYVTTNVSKPQYKPSLELGSYVLYRCGHYNCLTLYWKMRRYLDEEISGYSYNISQIPSSGNDMVNRTMVTILKLPVVPVYTLSVWAINTAGNSPPSTMQIHTQNGDRYKPYYVSTTLVRRNTYEVSYKRRGDSSVVDATVYYWCQGDFKGRVVDCHNSIQWKSVNTGNLTKRSNIYKYNITTASSGDWHFAVALFYNETTSGMVWGETVTSEQGNAVGTCQSRSRFLRSSQSIEDLVI